MYQLSLRSLVCSCESRLCHTVHSRTQNAACRVSLEMTKSCLTTWGQTCTACKVRLWEQSHEPNSRTQVCCSVICPPDARTALNRHQCCQKYLLVVFGKGAVGICGVCVDDGWLKQPHLARVRLIEPWGWVGQYISSALSDQCGQLKPAITTTLKEICCMATWSTSSCLLDGV